jgi:hypothetical protein
MKINLILMLIIVLSGCAAQSQVKKTEKPNKIITKFMFLGISNGMSKEYFCEVDTRISKCTGSYSVDSCREGIQHVYPHCSERLLQSMPDTLTSREEFSKYGRFLTECLSFQLANEKNMTFKELDSCVATTENIKSF